jgi:DNA helicase-2/ATP-dependent DNA helicase PcrA
MGSSTTNPPSRFLSDIPERLVSKDNISNGNTVLTNNIHTWDNIATRSSVVLDLKAGDRVRHDIFGEGLVISYRVINNDAEIAVAFDTHGVKKLLSSFARLEKIN